MRTTYIVLKHISGLALVFFTLSFIMMVTDLENLGTVATEIWLIKVTLIVAPFIINKWCIKKIADIESLG